MVAVETFAPIRGVAPGGRAPEERPGWSFERLSVDREDERYVIEFDPALTLVAVADEQVEPTCARLTGALDNGPDGVHVEINGQACGPVVVFRPHGARHRCVALDTNVELPLTDLAQLQVPPARDHSSSDTVAALAVVDQSELWAAAASVHQAKADLNEARATTTPAAAESRQGDSPRKPRFRLLGRGRADAGGPTDLTRAERAHSEALAAWAALAGDVDPDEACAWRLAIESTARVLERMSALAAVGAQDKGPARAPGVDVVAAAVAALMQPAGPGAGPAVLPFPAPGCHEPLDAVTASLVLETLGALAESRQVIVVTSDANVADWGRLETHARRARFVDLR